MSSCAKWWMVFAGAWMGTGEQIVDAFVQTVTAVAALPAVFRSGLPRSCMCVL